MDMGVLLAHVCAPHECSAQNPEEDVTCLATRVTEV